MHKLAQSHLILDNRVGESDYHFHVTEEEISRESRFAELESNSESFPFNSVFSVSLCVCCLPHSAFQSVVKVDNDLI